MEILDFSIRTLGKASIPSPLSLSTTDGDFIADYVNDDEKIIVALLQEKESVNIDELYIRSALSSSSVAAAILNLELNNVIIGLPGKIYKLL